MLMSVLVLASLALSEAASLADLIGTYTLRLRPKDDQDKPPIDCKCCTEAQLCSVVTFYPDPDSDDLLVTVLRVPGRGRAVSDGGNVTVNFMSDDGSFKLLYTSQEMKFSREAVAAELSFGLGSKHSHNRKLNQTERAAYGTLAGQAFTVPRYDVIFRGRDTLCAKIPKKLASKLQQAARDNNLELAKRILSCVGAEQLVNSRDSEGRTPWENALRLNSTEVYNLLANNGADIETTTTSTTTTSPVDLGPCEHQTRKNGTILCHKFFPSYGAEAIVADKAAAEKMCKDIGMELPSPDDMTYNFWLGNQAHDKIVRKNYWNIFVRLSPGSSPFTFPDGGALGYERWGSGPTQPEAKELHDCSVTMTSTNRQTSTDARWDHRKCTDEYGIVCVREKRSDE